MALSVNFNFWVFFRLPFLLSFQWRTCFFTVFAISFYIIFLNGPSFRILCNLAPRFCRCPMHTVPLYGSFFTTSKYDLVSPPHHQDIEYILIYTYQWTVQNNNNSFRFQWSSRTFMIHWTREALDSAWALCTFLIIKQLYHLYQHLLL